MAEPFGVDRARGSAKQSSASGRSQIRSYSYGSGARRFDPGAWPSFRPRLVVAIVGRPSCRFELPGRDDWARPVSGGG